jgi:hypothetical protein
MTDLDNRLESAANAMHRAVGDVPATGFSAEHSRYQGREGRRPERRIGLVAAGVVAALGVAGLVLLERRPDVEPADQPAAASSTSPISVAAVPTMRPLELADAPNGLKLVGQGIRPAAGQDLQAAVFVKRDTQGNAVDRVIVRIGELSLYVGDRAISPPPNLTTATSGDIHIDSQTVRVEYALGALGNLALDGLHVDEQTDAALADQMQALAAALDVADGKGISVTGQLPAGWELATAGIEPEQTVPSFYQAFEVDTSDGGPKIIVDNRASNDAGYPYWMMAQTLEPAQIRGHDGYVTTQNYYSDAGAPGAPTVANPTSSVTTLIWEETPGHWVTMWVADQTTEAAIRLANALVAIDQPQWHLPGAAASATSSTSLVSP